MKDRDRNRRAKAIRRPARAFRVSNTRTKRRTLAVQSAVAHQDEARIVGNLAPFVKVERQRIGPFDAPQAGRKIGRQHRQRAVGAVNVKPEFFASREIGQRRQIVDRAGVHGSRGPHEQKRVESPPRGLS